MHPNLLLDSILQVPVLSIFSEGTVAQNRGTLSLLLSTETSMRKETLEHRARTGQICQTEVFGAACSD